MRYKVNISFSAETDLFEIYKYAYRNDSGERADKLFSELHKKCFALKEFPNRGHIPKELSMFGMNDFLEIIHQPFRIIYQIIDKEVFIHCILNGRRDIQKLLYERLIRS